MSRGSEKNLFRVVVVGFDNPSALSEITTTLAGQELRPIDVQLANYAQPEKHPQPKFVYSFQVEAANPKLSAQGCVTALTSRLLTQLGENSSDGNSAGNLNAQPPTNLSSDSAALMPVSDLLLDVVLDQEFVLRKRLDHGGSSVVYTAYQLSLKRTVAIKILRRFDNIEQEENLHERLVKESSVLAQFQSPNIVQVLGAGTFQDTTGHNRQWLAMEYMAGGNIGEIVQKRGPFYGETSLKWFRDILEALQYAHPNSVLHRDVKPQNLLLTSDGLVKLSDFGLLKRPDRVNDKQTPTDLLLGTPHFMSPEQVLGHALDERSDIYSLGASFFEVFTGRTPFVGTTNSDILVQVSQGSPPPLLEVRPDIPLGISLIIDRMMAKNPDARYQNISVALQDLESYRLRDLLDANTPDFQREETLITNTP